MEADNKTYSYDQVYDAAIKYFKGDEMAASTWIKKYCLINKEGEYLETSPDDMHKRMALEFSKQEEKYNHATNQDLKLKLSEYGYNRAELTKEDIYNLFKDFKYVIPAGSVMAGLGSEIPVSLSNCWVISGPEDTLEDIFRVCNEQSQLMKRRGGVGFDISKLRPAGSLVNNSAKMSTGAASFMELFSNVTSTISQCIHEDHELLTKRGLVKIKDIEIGDEVWTKKGFVKVINKFDKGTKPLVSLKTKHGAELKATSDHVVMSASENTGPINKPISELKIGDPIVFLHGTNEIDKYQNLKYSYEKPIARVLSDGTGIPHNRYEDIDIPQILDEKLAYIVGYCHGDGYTDNGRNLGVSINTKDEDIINKIMSYRKDVFGYETHMKMKHGENCGIIHICATEGCQLLLENGIDKPKTEYLRIPDAIWKSPSSVQLAYLSGLFDADGYASGSKKGYVYCTVNKDFSNDIRKLLLVNGIFSKLFIETPKEKNWKTKYNVNVVGKYNQEQFVTKLVESLKVQKSKFVSKTDHTLTPFIIGVEGIKKQPAYQYKKFISGASLVKSGYYKDQMMTIDNVESISECGDGHVYDIELESVNMFWCDGFYVHNCGRRGALMLSINMLHPDALEFIEKKQDLAKVTGANVSVQIDDDFMYAVMNDLEYVQQWPIDVVINKEKTNELNGTEEYEYGKLYPMLYTENEYSSKLKNGYMKVVKAKEIWDKLIHCAWNTAEPGIIFSSRHHNFSPDGVYPSFKGTCTNPCIAGDTLIHTENGQKTIKEIVEKIKSGDTVRVLTCNETTLSLELKKVINGFLTKNDAKIVEVISNNGSVKTTPEHKFYVVGNGWVEAKDLNVGDELILSNGTTNVVSVTDCGTADVYDLQVKDNHNFFANGILVHNCGEIFMHEDSCRLIHLNLSSFIKDPFTENAKVDDELLYQVTYEAMRLADDLVDLEADSIARILEKIENDGDKGNSEYRLFERLLKHSLEGRRCGLGFLGLSDAIAMLGYKYDSDKGLESVNHILRVMFTAEMDCQTDMAITRGTFPAFDKKLELGGNEWYEMLKKDMPTLYDKNMKYGRRNISFSTVAPTGTVSLMAKRSSGIEPVFMPYYTRRVKCMTSDDRVDYTDVNGEKFTEYVVVHPTLKLWAQKVYGDDFSEDWSQSQWEDAYKKSPWFGSTAQEIDWTKRVELQGIVQKYTSHSISSTVNLPNNVTEESVSTIYQQAWRSRLKGITVYRDGCRSGVLVSSEEKKPKKEEHVETVKRRPKTVECKIFRFNNKGEKWVSVVGVLDGEPYEIFSGMQEKLNIPNWVEDGVIVKNYETVKDQETGDEKKQSRYDICYTDKDGYRVCVEGLSRTFNPEYWNYAKLISGLLRHHMGIEYIIKVISSLKLDNSTINTWKNGIIRTLRKFQKSKEEIVSDEKCPDCGGRLVRDGGCIHCVDCGWSRCE